MTTDKEKNMGAALDNFILRIRKKRIAVLGIGISNTPLIKMLSKYGGIVTACDKRSREELGDTAKELENIGVKLQLGEGYLDNLDHDIIFRTPGLRYDIPALREARQKGSEIISEMELFFDLCPAKIIGITGSDGKTTTTTLVYEMLKKQGLACYLGGNIGKPLLPEIDSFKESDYAVVELSSFQLQTMKKSPHIAIVTNVTPNHLDIHLSMDEYIEAKKNIFLYQNTDDKLILNLENDITKDFINEAKGKVLGFAFNSKTNKGMYYDENKDLVYADGKIETIVMNKSDIKLPGNHNVENYMAASLAVWGLVDIENIKAVARDFGGVPHRIELIRELNGVKYYNSSIDSSPTRTIAALNSFDKKVILIAGGYDKHIPFEPLAPAVIDKVKRLILTGATAQKIKETVETNREYRGKPEIFLVEKFDDAVMFAANSAKEGDVVILSPACASFDSFKNFEERGDRFKSLIKKL